MSRFKNTLISSALFLVVLCTCLLSLPSHTASSPQFALGLLHTAFRDSDRSDGNNTRPTAIEYFDALGIRAAVKLVWNVFSEKDVEGFRIYRMADNDSQLFVVNKRGLIPAWRQTYVDTELASSTTYRYVLGVVFDDGSEVFSQPAAAKPTKASHVVTASFSQPK